MKLKIVLLASGLALGSIVFAEEKNSANSESHEASPLAVDATAQKQLGIVTATVAARTLQDEIRAPGEVKANGYATVLVSPRIAAQIVRRNAKLGDEVKAGQALVTLSSIEVAEAQGQLIVGEREWQRVRSLGAEAVSAKRYTEAQVARDQAHAKLRAYGVGVGEIASLLRQGSARATGEFALIAPQAGRVTSDDFIVGERVESGKVLFTLVDESSVWIEAQLPPGDAERIALGAAARIVDRNQVLPGKVIQLAHRSTESSRTTPVRIEAANRDDLLHAGEFVDVFVATSAATQVVAIPNEAIVQIQGQNVVFKIAKQEHFEIAPIATGETRGDWTVVKQGLSAGDAIAVKGSYALKARLLKSQLGEGDAH
ncbi:efflux RND transporter periplasmic adaptor subunit [Rudaea sp.]|uniref:efflux RND transporter periplasmic adaptor subunit n=1 Tax=Rudaea sp. TaxID=2136325 RepID=UPI002ED3ED3D